MKTIQLQKKSGYSLVEVLVSVSVLLIAIVGPMTIAAQGIKSSAFSLEQNAAFFLAQEGIEMVFALRGDYALGDIDDGLKTSPPDPDTSWDWVTSELNNGACNGNEINGSGDSCDFGIDFSGAGGVLTFQNCNSSGGDPDDCELYIDINADRSIYTHDTSSNIPSPYTRIVTIEYMEDYAVRLTSKVTWNSHVFGDTEQTVTLISYIFDQI